MGNKKLLFKNNLVSLINRDGRLDLLDSDDEFIDYFVYDEDLEEGETIESKADCIIKKIKNMDEKELSEFIYNTFDCLKTEPYCDENDISELKDEWGSEYVVRIGSTAIIIKE